MVLAPAEAVIVAGQELRLWLVFAGYNPTRTRTDVLPWDAAS